MTRILLVAHAPFASALRDVAAHVFPECVAGLQAVDVLPTDGVDDVEAAIKRLLASPSAEDTLILVDAFGATPCNAAHRLADGVHVRVVAGVNVPMLWRTLCYRQEAVELLVERAVAGAIQGVMHVPVARRQNQSTSVVAHDQVQHSHQQ